MRLTEFLERIMRVGMQALRAHPAKRARKSRPGEIN